MSDSSPRLNLPYIAAAQAQKHVTVNQGLGLLDALVQCAAESRTVTTEPQAQDGQLWILPPGKTGPSWGAMPDHALAHLADGAWEAIRPGEGWTAFVKDEGESVLFFGGAWSPLAADRVSRSGDAMTGALSTPRLELNRRGAGGGALSVTDAGGVALAASAEPRLVVGGPSAGALFLDDGPFGRVDLRGSAPTVGLYATGEGTDRKYTRLNNFGGDFSVDALTDAYAAPATLMQGRRGAGASWGRLKVNVPLSVRPGASVTPEDDGEVTLELTTDRVLTFRAKGSDGVVRSISLTLA